MVGGNQGFKPNYELVKTAVVILLLNYTNVVMSLGKRRTKKSEFGPKPPQGRGGDWGCIKSTKGPATEEWRGGFMLMLDESHEPQSQHSQHSQLQGVRSCVSSK